MADQYESTPFTQKEVLTLVQKINQRDKKWVELKSANWSGLDLRGLNLKNARLDFANLSNSNLQYADLENANLRYADLRNADLSNAKLVSADLSEANCEGTKFDGATGLGLKFKKKWDLPLDDESDKKSTSTRSILGGSKNRSDSEATEKKERTESRTDVKSSKDKKEKKSKSEKDDKKSSSSLKISTSSKKTKEEKSDDESSKSVSQNNNNNNANDSNSFHLTDDQIKAEWDKADKDKSGSLSFKEIVRLLDKLNLKQKEKEVKKKFKEVDADNSGELDFEEFKVFLERLRVRPEIEELFQKVTGGKKEHLTAEEFAHWLSKEQGEKVDAARAKEIIADVEKKNHGKDAEFLYSTGFAAYLTSSKYNDVFNPQHATIYQDMNQPFTHYFIASSHNTYLLEDQLKGASSVEAYKNAFAKGCRCVELDCWDGEDKSMPIIYHGHTLTSKITFQEVIETIRDYGFKTTDYPVILSLEVHCGIEGQQAMAKIVKDILGPADMLPPQPEVEGAIPPPEKLKRKVLLKGKMLPSKPGEAEEPDDDEEEEEEEEASPKETKKSSKKESKEKEKKKPAGTAKELSDVIHLKSTHFKGFEESKTYSKEWHICSFSEAKVDKLLKKNPQDFIEFNLKQLSRIYPKGIRVDSSNYDPSPSWNCGSQVVALNYQTGSDPMWINDGKFMDNGGSGYLLKPKFLREEKITFNPEGKHSVQKTLHVTVISGSQLPKVEGKEKTDKGEVIDPYVKVIMYGVSADKKSHKTKVVKNNGFNPVWNNDFKFPIHVPELAILLFTVSDSDMVSSDDFIAQYSINVTDVREGFRHAVLKDRKGKTYEKASLLLHFKWV
eukprot:CAMPEP_0168555584 /NCGR_PEP_ID=MMETSP0413-20121227/8417_1 /TAXON_ID=136452 /ORGANISM="Filamoeba nolandi, Strain NC-AS-23-1" /LENGTH=837 /DNA_ID=CAMNT_0008586453 /DNA_START=37 /DNA_END=2550 /DNA_ORIENTATION=-